MQARHGFSLCSIVYISGCSVSSGWWHCSHSWSDFVPAPILKMFLVQRSWHGHPHSRWCGFQQVGHESMGSAWCLWYSTVVYLHPPTCSGWLRWIDHRSTPMTPMIIHMFGYLSGVLQGSFFVYVRQLFKFALLPLACITMIREGVLHIATSLCHSTPSKPHSTSMFNLVVLTRTCLNMLNWALLNLKIVRNG